MKFITDMLCEYTAVPEGSDEIIKLPRYAVWATQCTHYDGVPHRNDKPVVIDVGSDLEALQREYGKSLPIVRFDEYDEQIAESEGE